MGAPLLRRSMRIPGKLVKDPTDLTAAYPYGGTELGLVGKEEIRYRAKHHALTAEEWGEQVYEVISAGTSLVFGCDLRGFDQDAIATVFPDTAAGSKVVNDTRERIVRFRASTARAGTLLGSLSFALLFVPEDVKTKPGWLFYDAIPVLAEDAIQSLDPEHEAAMNVWFYARPDASDRTAENALIKDMTL